MPSRRLKDLLNAPLATAYARAIVFAMPLVLAVSGYACYHWINSKIAEAPSMVFVTTESADTKRRVAELEAQRGLDAQQATNDRKILTEVQGDVKAVLATVNKMAGAMEARSGVKLTGGPDSSTVAATP